MRIAVLSDIHANLEALESVVDDVQTRQVDKVICLGDMVGYGPDPNEVLDLVRELGYDCILGNHEAGFIGKEYRNWLNFLAKENNVETESMLSKENLEFCRRLPKTAEIENASFVHGFPPDSLLTYVKKCTDKKVSETFKKMREQFCVVGHTHTLSLVHMENEKVVREKMSCGVVLLDSSKKYIINGGSVGQPRDSNRLAKYIVLDLTASAVEVYCLEYDVSKTISKIEKRGFPPAYGIRLR